MAVAGSLNQFERRPDGTFRGWLRGITRRRIQDRWRQLERELPSAGGTEARQREAHVPKSTEKQPKTPVSSALAEVAPSVADSAAKLREEPVFLRGESMSKRAKNTTVKILGIPCSLARRDTRRAVRDVVTRVRESFPQDFARLREVILEIAPFEQAPRNARVLGEWQARQEELNDPATWGFGFGPTPGVMRINESFDLVEPVGVIAHEFGHACTTQEDRERRGDMDDEWRSEMAANWYAYRWGFGRNIRRMSETWDHLHHGPLPGKDFAIERPYEDRIYHFHVTRSLCARLVRVTTSTGELVNQHRPS